MIPFLRAHPQLAAVHTARSALVSDYWQDDTRFGGIPSGNYCGPTAASNLLRYLSDRGYPTLCPAVHETRDEDQHDLIVTLGGVDYMNTDDVFAGTPPQNMCSGLKEYILDCAYTYRRIKWQGWDPTDSVVEEFDTGVEVPQLLWVKDAVNRTGGSLLMVAWGYLNGSVHVITGGHWLSVVGYGWTGAGADPTYLAVHDPATSAVETKHLSTASIASGTFYVDISGLPHYERSAVGYLDIGGIGQTCWLLGVVNHELVE